MAQNEMIDSIIAQAAKDDITQLKKDIPMLTGLMVELSKSARGAVGGLGDGGGLVDVLKNTKAAAEATKGMNMASQQYNSTMEKGAAVLATMNGTSLKYVSIVKGLEQAELSAAKASTESAKAKLLSAKASVENVRQIESETRNTILLTKEKERLEKIAQREQAILDRQKGAYAQLAAEYRTAADEAQNLAAKKILLEREVAAGNNVQVNNTEIARLGPLLATAQANAMRLHTSLLAVDQAVGKSQRNVGNYNGAVMAMSQLLREGPSFAYSFSMGLMGISNNIPILADEIKRLKETNEALKASGKETIPVWKTLMGAFTSPIGIITTLTSVVTIFAARMSMSKNATEEAANSLDEYTKKLEEFYKATDRIRGGVVAEAKFDQSKAESQLSIMRDSNLTLSQRFIAFQALQQLAPNIFDNLDKEGFKTAENTERMKKQIETMKDYINMQVEISKGREEQMKTLALLEANQDEIDKKRAEVEAERLKMIRGGNGKQAADPAWVDKIIRETTRTEVGAGAWDVTKRQAELNQLVKDRNNLLAIESRYNEQLAKLEHDRAMIQGDRIDKNEKEKKQKEYQIDLTIDDEFYHRMQSRADYEKEQEAKYQEHLDFLTQMDQAYQDQKTGALNELNRKYQDGLISYEVYSKGKEEMDKRFIKASLMYHKAYYEDMLKQYPDDERIKALLSKTNSELAALYKVDVKNYKEAQKEKEKAAKDTESLIKEAVQQSIETNKAFVDAYYEKQIAHEESLINAIEERKQAEIDRINNTMQSEDKKQKQITALNAQTAAQEKQINAEIRRMKRDQAIADRVAATLVVVEHTAEGISRALKDYKWPFNLIPAGIVAALGAAQIAAIYAQPLPAYRYGTENHPGGKALVGEDYRPELVIEPGKEPYFIDKPTITELARHTRVIPEAELLANSMGFMTPSLMAAMNVNNDFTALQQETKKGFSELKDAIVNKPVPSWTASNGEWRKIVSRGNSKTEYINQNFS